MSVPGWRGARGRRALSAVQTGPGARPIVIFCGKGGVGKTCLSLATGLLHAAQGRRVVVVTSHPLEELAVSVSLEGLKEADATAASNLFVTHIDPRQILAQLFKGQMPSELLARTVISSRIYKSLIEVAPGLKEMAFLARLKELAERRADTERRVSFDLLIWDAPATGHFLDTLRVSRRFDTYLSGPFAETGREVAHFFSQQANLMLFPVAILEEMAVQETLELCDRLSGELGIVPAGVMCNLVSPLLAADPESFAGLERFARAPGGDADVLDFVVPRLAIERREFDHLRKGVSVPLYQVPRVRSWNTDLELLRGLGEAMRDVPSGM